MTTLLRIAAAAALAISFIPGSAFAFGLGGVTRVPKPDLSALYLKEGRRVAAPFAHIVFCVQQPADCSASAGPAVIDLTSDKKRELVLVNGEINHDIIPVNDSGNDTWSLAPREGDCEDYAITKRHALIAMAGPNLRYAWQSRIRPGERVTWCSWCGPTRATWCSTILPAPCATGERLACTGT